MFCIKLITALFCIIFGTAQAKPLFKVVGGVDFKNSPITTWTFSKSKHNSVNFTGTTKTKFLDIVSTGGYLQGTVSGNLDKGIKADLEVDLRQLKVKPSGRNEHMHDKYLETKKFPMATLTIDHQKPIVLGKEFTWEGKLTVKTETKPVNGKASFDGKRLTAVFALELDDYPAIGAPTFGDIVMASSLAVEVDAVAE